MNLKAKKILLREQFGDLPTAPVLGRQFAMNRILSQFLQSMSGIWGSFRAMRLEPDLFPILNCYGALNFAYPKIMGEQMKFFKGQAFEKSKHGFLEPVEGDEASKLAGVFVPGLAFDQHGTRLGRGKGHYDKFLMNHPNLKKVGVCFEEQLTKDLPWEDHDIRMDMILTDKNLISLK